MGVVGAVRVVGAVGAVGVVGAVRVVGAVGAVGVVGAVRAWEGSGHTLAAFKYSLNTNKPLWGGAGRGGGHVGVVGAVRVVGAGGRWGRGGGGVRARGGAGTQTQPPKKPSKHIQTPPKVPAAA